MERNHYKSKKNKPPRYGEKDKPASLHQDLKIIKENLKIKEMLKIVKINSSFRLKGPRGTKVITDNVSDIADNNLILESSTRDNVVDVDSVNEKSEVELHMDSDSLKEKMSTNEESSGDFKTDVDEFLNPNDPQQSQMNLSNDVESRVDSNGKVYVPMANSQPKENILAETVSEHGDRDATSTLPRIKTQLSCDRNRKMSLDQTILTRRESWSQSELDLHSVGKSPLERKSSFFRKKLDNFFKNTSEIFKRQSVNAKSETIRRKGSMSFSLQSLNEKSVFPSDMILQTKVEEMQSGSANNLDAPSKMICSASSLPESETSHPTFLDSQTSLVGSQSSQRSYGDAQSSQSNLSTSQPFADVASSSMNSLNDFQDPLAASRAYSVSSGLDTVHKPRSRRLASRTNRISWLANEGLAEYMRRRAEKEIYGRQASNVSLSYQDVNYVAETPPSGSGSTTRVDGKGRRLSYQRAVSGEDPVLLHRSSERRRNRYSPELETNQELSNRLAEFTLSGVPPLKGFHLAVIPDAAFDYLRWAEDPERIEQAFDCKKSGSNEEARQAVIRELVVTEADYIKHLFAIVEVFMAAAHALQDDGMLLDVDTERLFSNIPDVLNASLYFWESAIYPMLSDAIENQTPLNTEYMYPGFYRFRELFQPYEKYVSEQSKVLDYLRSLSSNHDFMAYLSWCHSHKTCNRLQLADILVKPMQRLTKYSILLRRVIVHTEFEPERTTLIAMESFAKNYVLDLNRSIRQKEEIEKMDALIETIDSYEVDFKDEEMDRLFRTYANINLKAPMVGCLPTHSRTLVYQGDLRFKDNLKETRIDVRAILLTDMLLICKKLSPKTSPYPYKIIRPKYMVDKMMHFPQYKTGKKEISSIVFVMIDEVGTAYHCFALSEPSKDSNPQTMKIWEQKIREAKMSYELGVWFARNPSRDLSELDIDTSSDYAARPGAKQNSEDLSIEREARERVAAMLHRCMGASTDYDISQASMTTDSFDGEASGTSGMRTPGVLGLRYPMHRNSTGGSSRNSRLSSFQQSTSAASHDEPQAGPSRNAYRCGSSVEHLIPPRNPEHDVTSITVNVLSESESETIVPKQLSRQKSGSRSPSVSQQHTLKVQPQSGVMALVHSLPDLTIDPSPKPTDTPVAPITMSTHSSNTYVFFNMKTPFAVSPSQQSASEKLYQSHHELLNRNRLSARPHSTHLLSPDHRGTSYPPPSPTRASLKRGLAFSYSIKNPPLAKMGHVNSQQLQADVPSTSHSAKGEKGAINPLLVGSTVTGATEKKSTKALSARSKGTGNISPNRKETD